MQQRDGPEEEKKELAAGYSSAPYGIPPFNSTPLPVLNLTEFAFERDQNGLAARKDSSKMALQLGPKISS